MVNFILQEAHEKANEIRVKVGRNFFYRCVRKWRWWRWGGCIKGRWP